MPRTPEQYQTIRNARKQLISRTALTLFASQGYQNTTISRIAEEAGISKGLLYNYFTGKEDLLRFIMESMNREIGDMIDPNHDGEVTDEEALQFMDTFFEMLIRRKEEMKLFFQISFQAQVRDLLKDEKNKSDSQKRLDLLLHFLGQKLPMPDEKSSFLTITSFLNGVALVFAYSDESAYTEEFMKRYKVYLKRILINAKRVC